MAYYPGQKVKHTNPRRITLAKILTLAVVLGAVYFGIAFIPPYWRYQKASSMMTEEAGKAYSKRRDDQSWAEIRSAVHARLKEKLLELLQIDSQDLTVKVEREKREFRIIATWTAYAKWPLLSKRTALKFREEVTSPIR